MCYEWLYVWGEAVELLAVMWYELGGSQPGRYIYEQHQQHLYLSEAYRHIHTFISHTQSLKIHFRNSDKSKNSLPQIIKLLIKTKVLHEEDCKKSRKYEYFGQELQKTNQDGFTVKNDDMKRSQRQSQKEKWKDQDQDH
ncbi:hypothetical protein Tco_0711618 [Tanacetum coccineum]